MNLNYPPFDCTLLVRKALPLPEVVLESGPLSPSEIQDKHSYAAHIYVSSLNPGNARLAGDVVFLTSWALTGEMPEVLHG